MADFDAIVVGAGCAGSVAAYELAKAGKSTLVVERGNFAGAKNMTGGRIYSHALKLVFPNFEEEAPLERRITHERISLMSDDANFTIDFSSKAMKQEGRDSYSVLRGPFDQWLAGKAEEAGAIDRVSSGLVRLFGCSDAEQFRALTGNTFKGIVHPDDWEWVSASISEQMERSDSDYVRYRIIRADGDGAGGHVQRQHAEHV